MLCAALGLSFQLCAATISAFSELQFEVKQGDQIQLEVVLTQSADTLWIKDKEDLCTQTKCTFQTSQWNIGYHFLNVRVRSKESNSILQYRIGVRERKIDEVPETVSPPLSKSTKGLHEFPIGDLNATMRSGGGYIRKHSDKAKLVNEWPQPIPDQSHLWTNAEGVLVLRKEQKDEHYLLPDSALISLHNQEEQRALVLKNGTLRSRNLAPDRSSWSILLANGIQFDTDAQGDVIISVTDTEATVSVLNGLLRIVTEAPTLGRRQTPVQQGECIKMTRTTKALNAVPCNAKAIRSILVATTPGVVVDGETTNLDADTDPGASPELTSAQLKTGRELLTQRNYLEALTLLIPFSDTAATNAELAYILGAASAYVHLHEQAHHFLKLAATLTPDREELYFIAGMVYLWDLDYPKARLAFSQLLDGPSSYYRGVLDYYAERDFLARWNLQWAQRETSDSGLQDSANAFMSQLSEQTRFHPRFQIGAFYDNNILNVNSADDLPPKLRHLGARGMKADQDLRWDLFRTSQSASVITLKADQKIYDKNRDLNNADLLHEEVIFDTLFRIPGGNTPWIEIAPLVKGSFTQFGMQAVENAYGWGFTTAVVRYKLQPTFSYRNTQSFDPAAKLERIYDVDLDEVLTATSDRSHRSRMFELGVRFPLSQWDTKCWSGITYSMTGYITAAAGESDHRDTQLGIQCTSNALYPHFSQTSELKVLQRAFPESASGRKDSRWTLALTSGYEFAPGFSVIAEVGLTQQKSTDDLRSFSKQFILVGSAYRGL